MCNVAATCLELCGTEGITARCLAQHVAAIAQVLERFEIGLDQGLNLDPAC